MCWAQISAEDRIRDEAEEVLGDIYDEEVREFYQSERERVRMERGETTEKKVDEENNFNLI